MPTLSLLGAVLLIAGCSAGAKSQAPVLKIGMIVRASGDPAGESAPAIGSALGRLVPLGADVQMLDSHDADDDAGRLNLLIAQDYNPIFTAGASTAAALHHAALGYPRRQFALIDGLADAPNIDSILIDDARPAFLCGALAALASAHRSVAVIADVSDQRREALEAGFAAGARQADPLTRVAFFNGGKEEAARAVAGGADVVLVAQAGREAALSRQGLGKAHAIGYGSSGAGDLATVPDALVVAVVLAGQEALAQKLPSGITRIGLDEGVAPVLSPAGAARLGPAGRMKFEEIRRAVVGRRIDPPASLADLKHFRPNAL